ncbi:MAG: hypothetical protein IT305_18795 [Chloroflexi bacterium]|nr:hypothetical protein [Chloroflexota bacterium]
MSVFRSILTRIATLTGRGAGRAAPGQIAVYSALVLVALVGLAGSGIDYGLAIVESSRMQNALDASALAGARGLVGGNPPGDSSGRAAATSFMTMHGYTNGVNQTTITLTTSRSDPSGPLDTMQIDATRVLPTKFWPVIGINTITVTQHAAAVASGSMVDVMMSLDLSRSMEESGAAASPPRDDVASLQGAVVQFIDQLQLQSGLPRGPQMGLARWAGIRCGWQRSGGGADGDTYLDLDRGPSGSEYVGPCTDDATILSGLTQDRARLVKIADGTGGGTCPPAASGFGCPLAPVPYIPTVVPGGGTPTPLQGLQRSNRTQTWTQSTGTKVSNAISIVSNGPYHAWSTANGGRNDPLGDGVARKILVLMTDGYSESSTYGIPSSVGGSSAPATWDTQAVSLANALKNGPNGVRGDDDDVEIFTVGYYCTPYNSMRWCASRLAASTPHRCPGPVYPTASPAPTDVDDLLVDISSSTPGTCDHYFPIAKGEDLPQMFRVIAGAVTRGRLQ